MKTIKICLLLLTIFCKESKSQDSSAIYLKATINRIDSTEYYIVIKATAIDNGQYITVLSPMFEADKKIKGYHDSCVIKPGKVYKFYLQPTNRIRNGEDSFFFVNLQKLYWGNVLILEDGQLPYIALNMFRFKLYD